MLRVVSRIMALLVLVSIGHDLTASCCDPLVPPGTTLAAAQTTDGAEDPCNDVCVPDCYCCSPTLAAGDRVRIENPAVVAHLRTAPRSIPSAGVGSVPDPVPRTTV